VTPARYVELAFSCFGALASGRLSTPALIVKVAEAKGFDPGDEVLFAQPHLCRGFLLAEHGEAAEDTTAANGRYVT
jgi:hypothetical protein